MEHTKVLWIFDSEIRWVNHPGEQEVHSGNYEIYSEDGETIIANVNGHIPEGKSNVRILAAAPELLEDAKSASEGYDWFRDQLNNFRLYHGAWDMDESEAWADSLIAHINGRQIGTKAVVAKAEGR